MNFNKKSCESQNYNEYQKSSDECINLMQSKNDFQKEKNGSSVLTIEEMQSHFYKHKGYKTNDFNKLMKFYDSNNIVKAKKSVTNLSKNQLTNKERSNSQLKKLCLNKINKGSSNITVKTSHNNFVNAISSLKDSLSPDDKFQTLTKRVNKKSTPCAPKKPRYKEMNFNNPLNIKNAYHNENFSKESYDYIKSSENLNGYETTYKKDNFTNSINVNELTKTNERKMNSKTDSNGFYNENYYENEVTNNQSSDEGLTDVAERDNIVLRSVITQFHKGELKA